MGSQCCFVLLVLVSAMVATIAATVVPSKNGLGGGGALVGSYKPIPDVKDAHVQEVAKFAVTEHNKQDKTNLRYDSVVKGQMQVVHKVRGNTVNNYLGEVYEKAWEGYMNLTSFKALLRAV
ncbi:hypothetical protein ACHQM5_023622 [Ranunculus cassubicifolius]